MDDVPDSFAARWTAHGLVLKVRGGELGIAAFAWFVATVWAVTGLVHDGFLVVAALHVVVALLLTVQARVSSEVELALDEVAVRLRIGPLVLRRRRLRLSTVRSVVTEPGNVAVAVVALTGSEGTLRIRAEGHDPASVEWLRSTIASLVSAARASPDDRPAVPTSLAAILSARARHRPASRSTG